MLDLRLATLSLLSSRAKRGICLLLLAYASTALVTQAQVKRPKILGVGSVTIQGTTSPSDNFFQFYSRLRLIDMGIQGGDLGVAICAINEHQELNLVAPQPSEPSNLREVLFETSDIEALHDYLQSKQIQVSEVVSRSMQVKDPSGHPIFGDASAFTLKDPDGHSIGFIQYLSPPKTQPTEGQVSSHLIHAGFIVKDRAAAEHFYKDILGFRPYWHGGMKDDEITWVSLQVPDGTDWLELMVYDPAGRDKHFRGVMNHIALGVTDIQAAKAQLIKNGVTLTEEPKLGRDGKWQLNLYDPDETRIEFMEFTPKEKPCCSEFTGPHPGPQK